MSDQDEIYALMELADIRRRELDRARIYALIIAESLHEKHWKNDNPHFEPLPDLLGLLTQIYNMVASLKK